MCSGLSKGFTISIQLYSPKTTGQQAKGLFDKAAARLR
jgi:hypothetical protein